ncbi:MAG TPA: enoyl-CoA hydratase/isomerase family protein [Candidatus Binatia bacterium]
MQKRDRAAWITLERAPLNVLNLPMLRELQALLEPLQQNGGVDLVILRGAGERAFSAGVDIKDHTREKVPEMLDAVHGVIRTLLSLPQITIAAVRGACLGGGCELASSCDFILATDDSSFATPEINVGCYPPVALARFPGQLGYRRAAEMILTGRRISAAEALAMGLITRVVAAGEFEPALAALAADLQAKSGAVLRIALKGLREISLKNFPQALQRSEEIYLNELLKTDDVEEGVKAFLEKRPPQWSHR